MSGTLLSLPHLRALIGVRVGYLGRTWVVIEILEEPPTLVLESGGPASYMQTDVHGRPWGFTAETMSIPALSRDRTGLSDELLALDLLDL